MTQPVQESPQPVAPRHKQWLRFSFSLRAMFVVVTVLGIWLGWQRHVVQERKRLLEWVAMHGGNFTLYAAPIRNNAISWTMAAEIPWVRTFLGDNPVEEIYVPYCWSEQSEFKQIDKAFPELRRHYGS